MELSLTWIRCETHSTDFIAQTDYGIVVNAVEAADDSHVDSDCDLSWMGAA